jgi:hypothetical protein
MLSDLSVVGVDAAEDESGGFFLKKLPSEAAM